MSHLVRALELEPIDNPLKPVLVNKVRLKASARIIHTGVMAKPTTISVVLRSTGREPQMELVPVIFLQETDDAPEVERDFVVLPPGTALNTAETLEYRGSFHYPQGAILFLFEVVRPPAKEEL